MGKVSGITYVRSRPPDATAIRYVNNFRYVGVGVSPSFSKSNFYGFAFKRSDTTNSELRSTIDPDIWTAMYSQQYQHLCAPALLPRSRRFRTLRTGPAVASAGIKPALA